ncbi:VOC family protein [Candidatus Entotheonella palauensis]|uniref:VOC domain-containing protein n=1 Tax=Candidatus Entotheonella gemina TaxID=1429439 RepID=W4MA24_9BACT|nr:VOC family protein [Candidatus Entotheonella palauensis]ETX06751.1 MAG: hypothetical protein ETSY2_15245 [Candidatus Entotheonella gemina]
MELASVCVGVQDMERAVAFYRKLFQAEPIQHMEKTSVFQPGPVRFVLLHQSVYAFPLQQGNNCVPTFSVADIESEHERVKQLEPPKIADQIVQGGPFRLFQFSDTEGNILECRTLLS